MERPSRSFERYEIIFALWISEACGCRLEEILYGNFELGREDYEKLKNFLKAKDPKELWIELEKIISIPRTSVKYYRSICVSPDIPTQIVLKVTHDEKEVGRDKIRRAIVEYGYSPKSSLLSHIFGILNFLKMGKWYKRSKSEISFVAYPEKMEILWPFLKDKDYKIPKKVINL